MKTAEELIHKIRGRTYETNDRFTLEIAYSDLEILITESEQTAKYKELVKAYKNLLDCFGIKKPEKSTHIDSLDNAFEHIEQLEKQIKKL